MLLGAIVRVLVLILPLLFAACRANPGMPVPDVAVGGDTTHFGRGIEAIRRDGAELVLRLDTAANVAVIRIAEDGVASLVHAAALGAGRHILGLPRQERQTVTGERYSPRGVGTVITSPSIDRVQSFCQTRPAAPAQANMQYETAWLNAQRCSSVYNNAMVRYQHPARAATFRSRVRDVIVVVATSFDFDPAELQSRLAELPPLEPGLAALAIPELLVGDRTSDWAGYRAER